MILGLGNHVKLPRQSYVARGGQQNTLLNGLTLAFQFDSDVDGSGNVYDSISALPLTVTPGNNPTFETPGLMGAGDFHYSESTPSGPTFGFTANDDNLHFEGARTVSFWLNAQDGYGLICGVWNTGSVPGDCEWAVYLQATTQIYFSIIDNTSTQQTAIADAPFGSWVHVLITYDGIGTLNLYINGALSGTLAGPVATTVMDSFGVATDPGNGVGGDFKLDELYFWNRVLTGTEISQLYNGGTGLAYPF